MYPHFVLSIRRAGLLTGSPFFDDLDHITECFDKTTKPRFRNESDPQYIKFGGTRDNDQNHGIRFGQLKLAGCILLLQFFINLLNVISSLFRTDVATFFQPSIDCVVEAIMDQRKSSRKELSVRKFYIYYDLLFTNLHEQHIVLVGGFAASDWLFERVKTILTAKGLFVIRPENHV